MYTPAVPVAQEWNGVVVAYLVLLVAAVSIYREEDFGLNALAGALLLLTIANIRNAWDLMLTITLATSLERSLKKGHYSATARTSSTVQSLDFRTSRRIARN